MTSSSKDLLRSRFIRIGISLIIGTISLYLAVKNVSWEEAWQAFLQAKWSWAGAGVLSVASNSVLKILRWRSLSNAAQNPVKSGKLVNAFLVGQMLNAIYPGRIGDLERAYVTGEKANERAYMLGTVVLEKVLDVLTFSLLAIGMTMLVAMPNWIDASVKGLAITGILLAVILWVMVKIKSGAYLSKIVQREWLQRLAMTKWGRRLTEWAARGIEGLEVIHNPRVFIGVIGYTISIWMTAFLTNWLVIQAFDMGFTTPSDQLRASLVLLVGLIAGTTLPAPGRIGVFEYICVLSLQLFDISQSLALSYGILLHTVLFFPPVLAGLVSLVGLGMRDKA